MKIQELAAIAPQKKWPGRKKMNEILTMEITDPADRFVLLMELLSYKNSLDFPRWNTRPKQIPVKSIRGKLYTASKYLATRHMVASTFRTLIQNMFHEFENVDINKNKITKGDFVGALDDKTGYKSFTVELENGSQKVITSSQDLKELGKELDFLYSKLDIDHDKYDPIIKDLNFMKRLWLQVEMIELANWDDNPEDSEKFNEALAEHEEKEKEIKKEEKETKKKTKKESK